MIPSSWLTVFGFFAFAAPGVMYDLLAAQKRAVRRESTLREVSRVVLVSTSCTALSALVVLIAGPPLTAWLPSCAGIPTAGELILADRNFLAGHTIGVSLGGFLFLAVSIGVALGAYLFNFRKVGSKLSYDSQWTLAFRRRLPAGYDSAVRVKLKNETVWFGVVRDFSVDLELADRELTLRPPLAFQKPGGEPSWIDHTRNGWGQVVIHGEEVESILVRYQRTSDEIIDR
ncbi:DUF6338 family protein [Williamsia maris]|uniref:PH (Pleckstrin Homology) domain-containing protein n=1 Tax=Williamsia maris TaxID=72806 RepID=A0ABT1HJJ2_9NOCA|nr:DUF6338 family protein [Williamsia maris]MCP2178110.1 hypothetical protein [Williamsia maris]